MGVKDMVYSKMSNLIKKPKTQEAVANMIAHNIEFADILRDFKAGNTSKDIIENFPNKSGHIKDFKDYLDKKGITIDEAVSIYEYSLNQAEIIKIKRRDNAMDELWSKSINNFGARLAREYPLEMTKEILNVYTQFISEYDYTNKGENQVVRDFVAFSKEIGINPNVCIPIAMDTNRLSKLEEHVKSIDNVLAKNVIEEDVVVYRGVNAQFLEDVINGDWNNLIGQDINNNFPTSTSKDLDSSFAKKNYVNLIFEIKIPKGTRGMDIEPLSDYGSVEKEILLAENKLHIDAIKTCIINTNIGPQYKMLAECTVNQKELLQKLENGELDKNQNKSNFNYFDIFESAIKDTPLENISKKETIEIDKDDMELE